MTLRESVIFFVNAMWKKTQIEKKKQEGNTFSLRGKAVE